MCISILLRTQFGCQAYDARLTWHLTCLNNRSFSCDLSGFQVSCHSHLQQCLITFRNRCQIYIPSLSPSSLKEYFEKSFRSTVDRFSGHLSELCVFLIACFFMMLSPFHLSLSYLIFVHKRMGCTFAVCLFFHEKMVLKFIRCQGSIPPSLVPLKEHFLTNSLVLDLCYFLFRHQKSGIAAMNVFPQVCHWKKNNNLYMYLFLSFCLTFWPTQVHGALLLM